MHTSGYDGSQFCSPPLEGIVITKLGVSVRLGMNVLDGFGVIV